MGTWPDLINRRFLQLFIGLILIGSFEQPLFSQTAELADHIVITPDNALESYIDLKDEAFAWELKESYTLGNVTAYHLLLTSQIWRGHTWQHQLTLFVPKKNEQDGALLFITGGSNQEDQPRWIKEDRMWPAMAEMADKNKAIVSILRQTPNQPLYEGKSEDELISFTLHNFREDKDYTWPLLFPMVKSAVKAMDAIQEFSHQNLNHEIEDFVISGASKRGWTTWLSAAIGDERIKAIAPMVIDVLNMPVNLQYQLDSYGEYSDQILDYVKLGIVQSMATEEGKALTTMIDPYSYRNELTIPKMIFIGTNDEYWTVDAIKHYYSEIPGKNMIHYVPNAGHNLGGGNQALEVLSAFFGLMLREKPYPVSTWDVRSGEKSTHLTINLEDPALLDAILWSATSTDRDFRDEKWESQSLGVSNTSTMELNEPYPKEGYKAFYVDMKYKDSHGGTYTVSTRIFLMDMEGVK